jgi:hypothetical protein
MKRRDFFKGLFGTLAAAVVLKGTAAKASDKPLNFTGGFAGFQKDQAERQRRVLAKTQEAIEKLDKKIAMTKPGEVVACGCDDRVAEQIARRVNDFHRAKGSYS